MNIKRQSDILTSMIDYVSSITNDITDFTVGSAVRSILDAVSLENEALYLMTYNNVSQGILEGMFSAFGFSVRKAVPASGDLVIEFYSETTNPVTIAKGTRFSNGDPNPAVYYETLQEYIIPAGVKSASITVYGNTPGKVGNVLAGEITKPETTIFNAYRVYNTQPFLTGQDAETYQEAQSRFASMIEGLGKSTKASVLYGVLKVPGIQLANIEEHVGYFNVYAGDGNGELSYELQQDVLASLDDYRAAGIKANVFPIDRVGLDVTMTVTLSASVYNTTDFQLALNKYVYDYLDNMLLDGDFIVSDFTRYVMNFDPVAIYDLEVVSPADNYITSADEVIRAGDVNIEFSAKE